MSIKDLSFNERSLLFAKLSSIAYSNIKEVKRQAKQLGFTTVEYYDKEGAQAYRLMNKTDLVIACRGTQPSEFADIAADLKATPVKAETISRVHRGFKQQVDDLWPMIAEDIARPVNMKKTLWFCGHSLGAGMATIMSSRAKFNEDLNDPIELYTYGCPRVGWHAYAQSLGVVHHRWRNNNDIVTTVPLAIMGYTHHGTQHYINAYGQVRNPSGWQLFKDKWRGIWMGLKQGKIDSFSDHSMVEYIKHLEAYALSK